MRKVIAFGMIVLVSVFGWARVPTQAEVVEAARDIVSRDSFQGIMADRTVESVSWVELEDSYGVWAVALAPGGHLVLGTSTKHRAMISWGEGTFVIPERASPQYALLLRAARRAAAAEAGDGEEHPSWTITPASSLLAAVALPADVILHPPVDTTTWAQGGVMAWYVPGDAPCGCVATANAQIMHALRWPVYAEGFFEATLNYTDANDLVSSDAYAFSPYSKFDYSAMKDSLSGYDPHYNNQQVARLVLLNDILARMSFDTGGSGAVASWAAVTPWTTGADCRKLNANKTEYTTDDITAIKAVMEAGVPVMCTIPGHAIVGSGYALYENEPYVRMNYGWGSVGNGWYHINDTEEYIIIYPTRTVQCDPLPAVSSTTPELSWHLPTCYADKVSSYTVTATEIPASIASGRMWRDSFTELSGTVTGNQHALRVESSRLHVSMSSASGGAGKVVYTWDPIFVPTANTKWTFQHMNYLARGPIHFQVLPLGGVWETVLEIDPGLHVSTNWKYTEIDLAKYAGKPCKLRLFAHPTVYSNYINYVTSFSMADMNVTGLSQVITASTETFTVENGAARSYTIPSNKLAAGSRYAFTVTPNFTDASVTPLESMPCYTQIATAAIPAEKTVSMTFTSPSPEAYVCSSMLMDQNVYRQCTYLGYSLIRLTTDPSIEKVELHSSHPTAYPDAAFSVEPNGEGIFDIVINSTAMPISPRVNDRLNLSVSALSAKGTRTTHELSLAFTNSETFAVSETVTPPDGTTYPTELFAEVDAGEATLASLTWTDAEGKAYDASEINWTYVTNVSIIVYGGTLTLDGTRNLTGTLMIDSDARVKLTTDTALSNLRVCGSGILECVGTFPTNRTGLTDTLWWTGTVELSGNLNIGDLNTTLEVLGHSKSKLLVSGAITGYLAKNKICEVPLELNGSITIGNGYTNGYYTFSKLTGDGTFTHNKDLAYTITFDDVSEFKGELEVAKAKARLVIGEKDDAVAGGIVVSEGKTAHVTFEKAWTTSSEMIVMGTLGGNGTIDSDLTFANGATLDVSQGPLTVTGAVTADGTVSVLNMAELYTPVLICAGTVPENPETIFLVDNYTAYALPDGDETAIAFRSAIIVPEGTTSAQITAALAMLKARSDYSMITEITNPDVPSVINNAAVSIENNVATFSYEFGVSDLTVTDGKVVAKAKLGENFTFADGVTLSLVDMSGNPILNTPTVDAETVDGDGAHVFTFDLPQNTSTFIFKVRATKQ